MKPRNTVERGIETSQPSPTQGSSALRRARVILAVLVLAGALAAFIDFRDAFPHPLKHFIASVQFVPSALTLATDFRVSALACLAVLALTLTCGRVYCSVLCPFGILQDAISRVSARLRRVPPYRLPFRRPRNALRYGILAAALAAFATGGGLVLAWLDPYSHFGRIAAGFFRPVAAAVNNAAASIASTFGHPAALPRADVNLAAAGALLPPLVIFIVLIVMASARGRLWCNTLCPVGALLGLVARRALWRIEIDKAACEKCADCLHACKAQCIDLRVGEIDFSRCVACFDCVSVCGRSGVKYRGRGLAAKRPADVPSSGEVREGIIPSIQGGKNAPLPPRGGGAGGEGERSREARTPFPLSLPREGGNRGNHARGIDKAISLRSGITHSPTRRGFLASAAASALAAFTRGAKASGAPCADDDDTARLDRPEVVAPPGGHSAARLLARCTACQLCVSACPSHVIAPAVLHYGGLAGLMKPRLDFERGFCNLNCTVCSEVCPDGALAPLSPEAKQTTRVGLAHIAHPRCIIVKDGTACGACAECCPTAALQMEKVPAHPDPVPVVDPRHCIGCGACQYACPTQPRAIVVSGLAAHEKAELFVQERVKPVTTEDFAF